MRSYPFRFLLHILIIIHTYIPIFYIIEQSMRMYKYIYLIIWERPFLSDYKVYIIDRTFFLPCRAKMYAILINLQEKVCREMIYPYIEWKDTTVIYREYMLFVMLPTQWSVVIKLSTSESKVRGLYLTTVIF